ncbi:MAG TPA: peptidoglycan-binding domain-containing protein [Polyangium sp.]|nr:peptidoglycan-binding domain-containing protein [Polyangium sp.]
MSDTMQTPNVFWIHLSPLPGIAPEALEKRIFELAKGFVLPTCPHAAASMFTHRIMRDGAGSYRWEIVLEFIDEFHEDATTNEPIENVVRAEIDMHIEDLAVIAEFSAFTSVAIPGPHVDVPLVPPDNSDFASFGSEDAPWYDYTRDSGATNAGKELPKRTLDIITEIRSAVPVEPKLKPEGPGHVYFALDDRAHRAWLDEYFNSKLVVATEADRRKIRAFAAFQTREGTTASINTYDSQIVTWGTGWGGLGWLGNVMSRASANPGVRMALEQAGVRYRKQNTYDIVDLKTKRVATGKAEALEVMRASLPLLYLLIDLARSSETREAVADAQLGTFFISAGDISSAEQMATQALFNMISHLKHWAPGYATGCLEWAVPQVANEPISAERDKHLARLAGRYFYGKARGKAWVPAWKQFQSYWRHMKEDGLDCLDDPFIRASSHPTDDPFASVPLRPTTSQTTANTTTTTNTTNKPATSTPAQRARILRNALLSSEEQLERVAEGKALLRRGAEGPGIRAIQQVLLQLGYSLPGGANGIFDVVLENIVKKFQREAGTKDDGIIGAQTIKKLDTLGGEK